MKHLPKVTNAEFETLWKALANYSCGCQRLLDIDDFRYPEVRKKIQHNLSMARKILVRIKGDADMAISEFTNIVEGLREKYPREDTISRVKLAWKIMSEQDGGKP